MIRPSRALGLAALLVAGLSVSVGVNAAGTTAISIPLKTTGLPIGLQLIARRGNDDKLLQTVRSLF